MAHPSNATITIDGTRFNALSANVGLDTDHDHTGLPMMGSLMTSISATVDANDTGNLPYGSLSKLFNLANIATRDKVAPVKVEFWQDEKQQDAICSYTFEGWISSFHLTGGGGANHTLHLRITPTLDQQNYHKLTMGN